jgi:uncharacterized protein YecE (DUF72 family)
MYKHWRGVVFEAGLPQRRWLERMAECFDTVEVNTSFYRVPKKETVENWIRGTPDRFLFALKLWRGITHYRKLKNSADLTERFLEPADAVPQHRRAPLLIQLPPNQGLDTARLETYIAELRQLSGGSWQIAVEFRHDDWLTVAVYRLLDRLAVALCIHDMAGRGATGQPNDAPFVYVRRHGSSDQHYAGSYSTERIRQDAACIRQWNLEGRDVYVYYNNDIGGHAFRNAVDLRAAIQA